MHHFVQRGNNENDYNPNGDNFNIETPWRTLFTRTLTDLRELINIGTDQESWHYVGVAQIMKAYSYSVMVDVWGDLPFSEALQGESIKDPVFDSDQSIYSSLFSLIDEGIANLAKQSFQSPGLDDLIYGGDRDLWRKFGKTLKLKLYNQVRLVQNVSGEVNALISEGDLISSAAEDFEFVYGPTISPDNRNPGYTQEWAPGGQFYYPSPYIFELMKGINTFHTNDLLAGIEDPRIPYYFYNQLGATADDSDAENDCSYCPSRSGTGFLSIWMFSFNIDPNEGFDQSSSQAVIGEYALGGKYDDGIGGISNFNGTGLAPQKLLNYYARLFIEAELAHAGVTSGDPRALFESAVRAALAKVDEVAGNAGSPTMNSVLVEAHMTRLMDLYDNNPGQQMELIMTQKWIANYGFGIDPYTDFRRTGFPILHDGNTDNLDQTVQGRTFPVSLPYAIRDLSLNPNAPPQRVVASDKIFWDAN